MEIELFYGRFRLSLLMLLTACACYVLNVSADAIVDIRPQLEYTGFCWIILICAFKWSGLQFHHKSIVAKPCHVCLHTCRMCWNHVIYSMQQMPYIYIYIYSSNILQMCLLWDDLWLACLIKCIKINSFSRQKHFMNHSALTKLRRCTASIQRDRNRSV